ncbi:MAG TPA: GNAT family N-acetyltransferase, partial [Allosphingosinicella sp.]|nr:GNAT family N-acetyltransferase [Allosphingosinicella sp.]
EIARMPVAPVSELMLVGHTEDGRQIRVAWFDHFRFDGPAVPVLALSDELIGRLFSGVELRPAWRLGDRRLEQDAIDFWTRLNLLPPGADPEQRAGELAAIAYKDGRVAGVTTIALARMEQVRARLGMMRGAVDPEHRRSGVGLALLFFTRPLIERWSMDHPEERVAGLGAVMQTPDLAAWEAQPYWPKTGFGLIGFAPDGNQVRVSWFRDFRLD